MLKLLVGMALEAFIGISLAGVILGLVIPALGLSGALGQPDLAGTFVIVGVLVAAVALALFRPGSALRRYFEG
jgi:hypothetical protein